MAFTRGRCINFDYCSVAESRRDVDVKVGEDFICPECGKPLKAPQIKGRASSPVVPILLTLGVLVLVGGAVFLGMRMGGPGGIPGGGQSPLGAPGARPASVAALPIPPAHALPLPQNAAAPPAAPAENVLARVHGAATMGSTVLAPLAAAYLAEIGDTAITTSQSGTTTRISGLRGGLREAIVIDGDGVPAGFGALAAGQADLVMTPRRILPAEQTSLAALGDMTQPGTEHVLALDAQAVVVNPSNQVSAMTRAQIRDLFAGGFTDWAPLGGPGGPVDIYAVRPQGARKDNQGQAGDIAPEAAPGARWVADEPAIGRAVVADLHGVGLVDLAAVGSARVMPIAETGAAPVSPTNHAAVLSNDYPLSYKLYLYGSPKAEGGFAQRFVAYALSPQGQAVVEQQGLISPTLKPAPVAVPQASAQPAAIVAPAPVSQIDRLRAYVAGAKKLAIVFRFTPSSTALDQYGERDLDRVTNYLVSMHDGGEHLLLAGFADNQGDPATNVEVSRKRAAYVAALFVSRGLKPGGVEGFGAELPVADNATEAGRERNRRVEVYVRP